MVTSVKKLEGLTGPLKCEFNIGVYVIQKSVKCHQVLLWTCPNQERVIYIPLPLENMLKVVGSIDIGICGRHIGAHRCPSKL